MHDELQQYIDEQTATCACIACGSYDTEPHYELCDIGAWWDCEKANKQRFIMWGLKEDSPHYH